MDQIDPTQQSDRASYKLFSPPAGESETQSAERKRAWKGDSFSFGDFLDMINPLQHLPVVSTLYRWITGDTIGALPRIVGDAIYGGPIGFVTGLINAEVKQESGKDVGEQVIAALGIGGSSPASDPKTIAAAEAPRDASPSQPGDTARSDAAPPVAAAVAAASAPAQPSGTVAAAVPVGAAATATAPRAAPVLASAAAPADPRALFLAHQDTLHRQLAADNGSLPGRALSNRVVPLQGFAVPPGLLTASAPAAARAAARPAVPEASGAPPTLPTNPPIDISQQMMDALDKYTRLQRERGARADAGRGAQLDVMQ